MSLVHTDPSGGQLWQGGNRDIWTAASRGVKVVILAAEQVQPDKLPGAPLILRSPLRDIGSMEPGELARTKSEARRLSDAAAAFLRTGVTVLSSCVSGFNRSGMISALTLVKLGLTPDAAIEQVRKTRSEYAALCNDLFCRDNSQSAISSGLCSSRHS